MTNQTVRGTKDFLFDEWYKFKHIEQTASRISNLYGFLPAQTPIFEYTTSVSYLDDNHCA